MANLNITSSEFGWCDTQVALLGRVIKGITGWEFKKSQEKELMYGAGAEPLDISSENIKYEGSIKLWGFELDAMNTAARAAGYEDILELPHEAVTIVVQGKRHLTDRPTVITATGVAFTEVAHALEQNAKNREYTLPFVCMNISTVTL